MAEEKKAFFTYKGVPLVRKGNNIYFGNMYDEFVVMIEILSTEKVGGIDVANKVRIRKGEQQLCRLLLKRFLTLSIWYLLSPSAF